MLTREQEKKLILQIVNSSNGEGHLARTELLHMSEFLIGVVVSKYPNLYVSAEELFKVGKKALGRALDLYIKNRQFEKKFKFTTYSLYFIKKAIISEIAKEKMKKDTSH